jgi:hypothetical protein
MNFALLGFLEVWHLSKHPIWLHSPGPTAKSALQSGGLTGGYYAPAKTGLGGEGVREPDRGAAIEVTDEGIDLIMDEIQAEFR